MKLDKETLIKQKFWILLGLAMPLLLVAMLLLWTSVAGAIQKQLEEIDGTKKKLEGIKDPRNKKFIDQYQETDAKIAGKQNEVWEKAWRAQAKMMTWPTELSPKYKDAYFGDPIDHFDRSAYSERLYTTQFRTQLYDIVQPVDPMTGEGVVQFNGSWEQVIRPIRNWPKVPTNEDIWLSQEDIWVKRELLRVVRDANDVVAIFRGPKPPPADAPKPTIPAGRQIVDHKVFHNADWEANLVLTRDLNRHFLQGTVKNISHRRLPLGMYLLVRMQRGDRSLGALVPVDGEPLAVGESVDVRFREKDQSESPVDRFNAIGLFGVEQIFSWRTAPVKRIDVVQLGYPAHRIADRKLKPYPAFEPLPEEGVLDPTATALDPTMGEFDVTPGGMAGGMTGMETGAYGQQALGLTENGLAKNRYVDVTSAVRRMPVAMTVVVEQSHIQDVLTAFANSKLRIQTMQVHWERLRGSVQPQIGGMMTGTGMGGGVDVGAGGLPGVIRPGMPSASMGQRQMYIPPPARDIDYDSGDMSGYSRYPSYSGMPGLASMTSMLQMEEDMNLVTLTVYGLASLYERFPPKAAPAEAEAPPADPAAAAVAPMP